MVAVSSSPRAGDARSTLVRIRFRCADILVVPARPCMLRKSREHGNLSWDEEINTWECMAVGLERIYSVSSHGYVSGVLTTVCEGGTSPSGGGEVLVPREVEMSGARGGVFPRAGALAGAARAASAPARGLGDVVPERVEASARGARWISPWQACMRSLRSMSIAGSGCAGCGVSRPASGGGARSRAPSFEYVSCAYKSSESLPCSIYVSWMSILDAALAEAMGIVGLCTRASLCPCSRGSARAISKCVRKYRVSVSSASRCLSHPVRTPPLLAYVPA